MSTATTGADPKKELESLFIKALKYKGIPEPTNTTTFHFCPIDQKFTVASTNSDVHLREDAVIKTRQGVNEKGEPVFFNHISHDRSGNPTTQVLPMLVDAGSTPATYTNRVRSIPSETQTISIHPGVGVQCLYDMQANEMLIQVRHKCQLKNVVGAGGIMIPRWSGELVIIGAGSSFLYPLNWGKNSMEIMALYFHPNCTSSPVYWSPEDKKKSGIDIYYPGDWYLNPAGEFKCHTTDNVETQGKAVVDYARHRVMEMQLHAMFTDPVAWERLVAKLNVKAPYGIPLPQEHEFNAIRTKMGNPNGFNEVVEAMAQHVEFDTLAQRAVELGIASFVDGRWMFTIGTASTAIPNVGNKESSLHEMVMSDQVFAIDLQRLLDNARNTISRNRGSDENPNKELTIAIDSAIENGQRWVLEGRKGNVPEFSVYLNDAGMWCGFNQNPIIGVGNATTPEEKRAVLHSHWEGKINKTNQPLKRVLEMFASKVTDPRNKG